MSTYNGSSFVSHERFELTLAHGKVSGNAFITPTSFTHCFIDTMTATRDELHADVRGISYHASLHIYRDADTGLWMTYLPEDGSVYAHRAGGSLHAIRAESFDPASTAAERSLAEGMLLAGQEWAETHIMEREHAAQVDANNEVWRLEEKLREATDVVNAIRHELREPKRRLKQWNAMREEAS